MRVDDSLYKSFLEELNALENFRIAYASDHPDLPLDRDDPDVKRLMEAMAFFSARTRVSAVTHVIALQRRIFHQFFPFLLSPVPAMGIVQVKPTGQFSEPTVLPGGSEIAVGLQTGGTAFFRTLFDLRIMPIRLSGVKMLLKPDRGFRLLLQLAASYPRNDEIGGLSLHITHMNDYPAALKILHAIKEHMTTASVAFDEDVTEMSSNIPCPVTFGQPPSTPLDDDESIHPLLQERWFFHFPQQELYLNFHVPVPPRNWQRFTLCLDLGPRWPRSLILNKDIFQLFTVPVMNLRRGLAQPIICDGTQEHYPIRHPHPELRYELHSVLGVYEVVGGKMVPMRSGVISGGSGSYEIDQNGGGADERRRCLVLHFPKAFEAPRTIAVDGLWVQPWYSQAVAQRQHLYPFRRSIVGTRWEWLGSIRPHAENSFLDHIDSFTHLLTLANKSVMSLSDVSDLLDALGSVRQGEFQKVHQLLSDCRMEQAPQPLSGRQGLIEQVYTLSFKDFDPILRPLVVTFANHIERVLDTWISDAKVRARLESPGEGMKVL